eukprot:jgi/Mesen1/8617/ME000050S08030
MVGPMNYQAVLLVDNGSKELFPLVSKEVPKALLPVGNKPLLQYSLELLEACSFGKLFVVVAGEDTAKRVASWIEDTFDDRINVQVTAVPEDAGSAHALRAIASNLTAHDVLVMSGDVVTDVPLGAVAAAHRRHSAALTMLLGQRAAAGGPADDKGKSKDKAHQSTPPRDFIALDPSNTDLLFCASGSHVGQQMVIRRSLLRSTGQMTIRTDLEDAHVYAFDRRVLQEVLEARPNAASLKHDLLPYLNPAGLSQQTADDDMAHSSSERLGRRGGDRDGSPAAELDGNGGGSGHEAAVKDTLESVRAAAMDTLMARRAPGARRCCVHMVPPSRFCARVNTLQAFADANRDVAGDAVHLTGYTVSTHNNVLHESAQLGAKSTVGPHCMVGEGTAMGDKCSVKKSLVGRHCRIGSGVKVINSVVMDHVVIGDGCLVQNSVLSNATHMLKDSILKDCHVGAGYSVAERAEHKGEALARKDK